MVAASQQTCPCWFRTVLIMATAGNLYRLGTGMPECRNRPGLNVDYRLHIDTASVSFWIGTVVTTATGNRINAGTASIGTIHVTYIACIMPILIRNRNCVGKVVMMLDSFSTLLGMTPV